MSDMSKNHDIKNGTNDSNNKSLSMDLNFPDDQSLYSGVDNIMDSIQLPPPEYFNNDDTLRTWNPMGQQWGNSYVPIADLVVPPFPDLINEHPDMMNENYSNNYREGELLPYPSIASCTPTEIFNLEQPHYHPTTHMDKPFDPIFLRNTLPLHQTSPIHSSENQTKLRFQKKLLSDCTAGLSKVAIFAEGDNYRFICGTTSQKEGNHIVFGSITTDTEIKLKVDVKEPINFAQFYNQGNEALLALNDKIIKLDTSSGKYDVIGKHNGAIREFALSGHQPNRLLSGGFDKQLLVTNVEAGVLEKAYPTRHVIGSVRWYPDCEQVVSFTSDVGLLSIFDIREGSSRVPIVYNAGNPVYSHEYANANLILVAQRNGVVELYDIRKRAVVQIVEDKTMSLIGDVVKIQDKILLSGSSLSLWKQLESEPTVMRIGNCSLDGTGTNTSYSGTFINSHSFMVTDSCGNLGVFDIIVKD